MSLSCRPCGRLLAAHVDEVARHDVDVSGKVPDARQRPSARGRKGPRLRRRRHHRDALAESIGAVQRRRRAARATSSAVSRTTPRATATDPARAGSSRSTNTLLPSSRGCRCKRQCDEIAESALGQRVLAGEEAVVGVEADLMARAVVRVSRADPSRRACAAGIASAKNSQTCAPSPDRETSTLAGTPSCGTDVAERRDVAPPLGLVEVEREEAAGLVGQQWVDADRVPAREMVADHRVGDGEQLPVGAVGALDLGLAAQGAIPLVSARRRVAGPARLALPAHGEHVIAAAEEGAKEASLAATGDWEVTGASVPEGVIEVAAGAAAGGRWHWERPGSSPVASSSELQVVVLRAQAFAFRRAELPSRRLLHQCSR